MLEDQLFLCIALPSGPALSHSLLEAHHTGLGSGAGTSPASLLLLRRAPACSPAAVWTPLLPQLLQQVLGYCSARELGALEASCSYFIKTGLADRVAKHFLKDIPRAKGLKPEIRQAGLSGHSGAT